MALLNPVSPTGCTRILSSRAGIFSGGRLAPRSYRAHTAVYPGSTFQKAGTSSFHSSLSLRLPHFFGGPQYTFSPACLDHQNQRLTAGESSIGGSTATSGSNFTFRLLRGSSGCRASLPQVPPAPLWLVNLGSLRALQLITLLPELSTPPSPPPRFR